MQDKNICKHDICTGCGLCKNICPKNCIEIKYDKDGFLFPFIDEDKCIHCNLCRSKCPMNADNLTGSNKPIKCYKTYSLDKELKMNSTSGGVFSTFSKAILEDGGIVYGAELNKNMDVELIKIDSLDEISRISGSKYIGSNVKDKYKEIKTFLDNGVKVLFSGTPCQVYALNVFFGKKYDNLITCDFVCHGVGSTKIFKNFLKYLEEKEKKKIETVCFRNKDKHYKNSKMKIVFYDKSKKYYPSYENAFGYPFSTGMINRESCYNCKFSTIYRYSDITMADYIKDLSPLEKKEGCSMILLNTEKGFNFYNSLKKYFIDSELELEVAKKLQMHLNSPLKKHEKREEIFKIIDTEPFENLEKGVFKLRKKSFLIRAIKKAKRLLVK